MHSGRVFVERGTPLKEKEFLFQVFVRKAQQKKEMLVSGYIRDITARFTEHGVLHMVPRCVQSLCFAFFFEKELNGELEFVGDVVLAEDMRVQEVKHLVYRALRVWLPPPDLMRIYDFSKEWDAHRFDATRPKLEFWRQANFRYFTEYDRTRTRTRTLHAHRPFNSLHVHRTFPHPCGTRTRALSTPIAHAIAISNGHPCALILRHPILFHL